MNARALLERLLRQRSGIAATEFALAAPLMILAWLSMAQLAQQTQAAGKASLVAQSLADLSTQMNPPPFADLVTAAGLIMAPFSTAPLSIDIVGITFDAGDAPTQSWRCTSGSNVDATVPLSNAAGLGAAGQAVIMVTVKYTYTPTITGGVLGSNNYTERSFNTPRLGSLPGKSC